MLDRRVTRNPNSSRPLVERRNSKKDIVNRLVTIFAFSGWLFTLVTLFFLDRAKPEREDFFTRLFNVPVHNYWNSGLLKYALYSLIAVFGVCFIGFLFNTFRHRRKTDRYNGSILVLGGISFLSIVLFLWKFYSYL